MLLKRIVNLLTGTKLSGVTLLIALAVLWEISVRLGWIEILSWPALSSVLVDWVEFLVSGEIIGVFWPTLKRLAVGYAIAVSVGITLGIPMGYFKGIYNLFEPTVELLRPIPIPAYIPVVILFLGIDDEMKIFMVALACVFPILLNTYSGVRAVDPVQIQTGRTFGLGTYKILRQIVLPASAPYIFTGLRISLGVSLIVVVLAEMITSVDGIGFYILQAQRTFRVENMYSGIISLGLFGYLLNLLFVGIEQRILRWHFLPRA